MKILLTSTSVALAYGGPAYSVSRLARALAEKGLDVGLWSSDGSVTNSPLLSDDTSVTRLTGLPEEVIRSFGPSLVHDNGLWLPHNHAIAAACRSARIARLVSTRGMLEPWARRHKKWKKDIAWYGYQRRDLRSADGLHATATEEADNLKRQEFNVPVYVIPNGVDIPAPRPLPRNNEKVALFMGRLYPVKGLPLLVEAWARVRPAGWRLVLAGPDEAGHQRELEMLITRHDLNSLITFAGTVSGKEKEQLFHSADLFVLPSHSESFGMAVGEALAHGLPVLTTRAVPWPELENGMGWRKSATVEGLTEGLREATSTSADALRQMGELGRVYVSGRFGWDNVAEQFLAAYTGIMARKPGLAA